MIVKCQLHKWFLVETAKSLYNIESIYLVLLLTSPFKLYEVFLSAKWHVVEEHKVVYRLSYVELIK